MLKRLSGSFDVRKTELEGTETPFMIVRYFNELVLAVSAVAIFASQGNASGTTGSTVGQTGVSGLWILSNISYAGMRAQNSRSAGWRILSFIFGFPGTLLTFFVVTEGSCRAYGIDLTKR
jgi:hypothetical protein